MKFWSQREFRRDYRVDRLIKRALGACESNLERNDSVGNRAFLEGPRDHMKIWVMFGRFFILSPKKFTLEQVQRYRPALATGVQVTALNPLQIWLHPQGICEISKTDILISPLKDVVENNEKQFHVRNRILTFQNKEARHR